MPNKIKTITEDAKYAQAAAQKALGVAVAQAKQIEALEDKLRAIKAKLPKKEQS
jgi:hypothetical protein